MKLTDGEKLILLMLTEIYDRLEVDGDFESDFLRSAIFSNNEWSIPWKYVGIPFENQESPEIVHEVLDILDMWRFIEWGYDRLSISDQERLAAQLGERWRTPRFLGFDGNHESNYLGTASFIINQLDRFEEFKGRDLNSHFPCLPTYKRMLAVFEPIRARIDEKLTVEELTEILQAKYSL